MLPETSDVEKRRRGLGLTQQQLSQLTGITRTSITKLERGQDMRYSSVKNIFDTLLRLECERDSKARFANLTLGDVCHSPVVYARFDEPLRLVAARMIEEGFSQLPVQEGGRLVGCVTESGINRAIASESLDRVVEFRVGDVLEPPFPVLDEGLSLALAVELLRLRQAVLAVRRGVVVGIVTNTDLYRRVLEG